jgi:membrane-associated protein
MDPVTGIAIVDWFLGLLDSWGYLLVTLFTISENLFVIGSFTPGETVVMAAAFLSTPEQGHLVWPLVWICSVIGTVTGSNISYWFGRKGGRDGLMRMARRFRVGEERLEAAEAYFYMHGSKTVFLSRFAAVFKNFVPVIAGMSRMNLAYFEGWTLLGAVTYTSLMCAIGYFVGNNFDKALQIAASLGYAGLFLFVALIAVVLFGRRKLITRRTDRYAGEYAEDAEEIARCIEGTPGCEPGSDDGDPQA